jgi:sigma-B regulation protein RsbU (phosphoserine phosphatase)
MLLRTRIALLLALALALVIASLVALGWVRTDIERQRLAELAVDGQFSLWTSLVEAEVDDLDAAAAELAIRLAFRAPALTRDEIAAVIAASPDIVTTGITVQVQALSGELIAANAPTFRFQPLVGTAGIETLMSGAERIGGLRQERPDAYVVAVARTVDVGGEPRAVLSVAVDAADVLQALADSLGEPAYLMSLRGRMVEGTDPALWQAANPVLPSRRAYGTVLDLDGRSFFAAAAPVPDMLGGIAGSLVTIRDVTEGLVASRRLERSGVAAVGLLGLVIVALMYLSLRRAFAPLEEAIGALDALSKGDLQQTIDPTGSGEIRRIGEAVSVFRRNALQLVEQEDAIKRQRRRQERLMQRQLERLAETLDPDGRAEVLAEKVALEADPAITDNTRRSNEELAVLARVLGRMSQRITDQHHRLTELIRELQDAIITRARLAGLEQELQIARELQLSFLPRPLPPHPTFDIHGLMETAKEVGGDFFDYFMIDDDRLGIVVADVSGKGVPAALFMAITRTLIKATALTAPSPAVTVSEVNTFLAADNEQMMFVTVFHAVLDCRTGRLDYVNAGHPPPLLIAAKAGALSELPRAGGPALAVVEGFPYEDQTLTLAPGDTLFIFTDGVTEAFDSEGHAFGDARLLAEVRAVGTEAAVEALDNAVRDAVLRFEQGAERADDVTCVALRYLGT